MGFNSRPVNSVNFLKRLPAFYARDYGDGGQTFSRFLAQFEELFDGFQSAIAGDALTLTYRDPGGAYVGGSGRAIGDDPAVTLAEPAAPSRRFYQIPVNLFDAGRLGYPKGALVFIPGDPDITTLAQPIAADSVNNDFIVVTDRTFLRRLKDGDPLVVRTNTGLAGLTNINETPPSSYAHLEGASFEYLRSLASWVGLPLRSDKLVSWNRRFFREAVAFDNGDVILDASSNKPARNSARPRSTLYGIKAMLDSWHHEEAHPVHTIVTDLISPANYTAAQEKAFRKYHGENFRTVFRLDESRIGIDSLLGEGEKDHFHVYLTTDPDDVYTRQPKNIDAMAAAAELILNLEKPVGTSYTLHISAHTMRLAPDLPILPYNAIAKQVRAEGLAAALSEIAITEAIGDAIEEAMEEAAKESGAELAVDETNTFARIGVTTLLWE